MSRSTVALFAAFVVFAPLARAQDRDLRRIHEQVVYSTVQIVVPAGWGSGWLLWQPTGRPLVVTNKHVAAEVPQTGATVRFYAGSEHPPIEVRATRFWTSQRIDLAILQLQADPPATARPLQLHTSTTVVRGQRVVLGGNPSTLDEAMPFQTTEGVVTGQASGPLFESCGAGRNCVVIDAGAIAGSSGGPAFNVDGDLVGMLWGVAVSTNGSVTVGGTDLSTAGVRTWTQNSAFGYLIHVATIAEELRTIEQHAPGARAGARPVEPAHAPQ